MRVRSNGIELEVETFGDPGDPAIVLIMGLATQLVHWPLRFCERLAAAGHYVVRFDNRDVGLSTSISAGGRPSIPKAWLRARLGLRDQPAYTLSDMAEDVRGLLDALDIERAHVVGLSMGGMIAQILAAAHPERLRALTLMMTSSGARGLPGPSLRIQKQMITRPESRAREALIAHSQRTWRLIGSPAYPPPEDELQARLAAAIDRAYTPAGVLRQMHAIIASGSRVKLLPLISTPTLVLHGEADPLVPVAAGRDLARRIPGARLLTLPGWGHDLPTPLLPRLADEILRHDPATSLQAAA
jgi:pimeloyl-ACP methyl ester carboxylesterase